MDNHDNKSTIQNIDTDYEFKNANFHLDIANDEFNNIIFDIKKEGSINCRFEGKIPFEQIKPDHEFYLDSEHVIQFLNDAIASEKLSLEEKDNCIVLKFDELIAKRKRTTSLSVKKKEFQLEKDEQMKIFEELMFKVSTIEKKNLLLIENKNHLENESINMKDFLTNETNLMKIQLEEGRNLNNTMKSQLAEEIETTKLIKDQLAKEIKSSNIMKNNLEEEINSSNIMKIQLADEINSTNIMKVQLADEINLAVTTKNQLLDEINSVKNSMNEKITNDINTVKNIFEIKYNELNSIYLEIDRRYQLELIRRFNYISYDKYTLINSWMPGTLKDFLGVLLYKATRDGFAAKNFHDRVDNHSNILVIGVTQNNETFGAYTPLSFGVNGSYKKDGSMTSFLFNLDRKIKYPIKIADKAVCDNSSYGPIFGSGNDLLICDNSNSSSSSSSVVGHTYENTDGKNLFEGSPSMKEIEVFLIR